MKMMSCEEVAKIIKENMDGIKKYGVKRIGLFGSFARGEQGEGSDIDILVEFEEGKATLDNFMDLAYFLERSLGKDVDLITLEGVKSIRVKGVRRSIEESVIYVS